MMSPMIATMGLIGVVIYGAIKAVGYLTDAFRAGYKWISGLNWGELGTNLVNGIVHGVKSGAQWVIDAVKNLGTGALEAFKSVSGSAHPAWSSGCRVSRWQRAQRPVSGWGPRVSRARSPRWGAAQSRWDRPNWVGPPPANRGSAVLPHGCALYLEHFECEQRTQQCEQQEHDIE